MQRQNPFEPLLHGLCVGGGVALVAVPTLAVATVWQDWPWYTPLLGLVIGFAAAGFSSVALVWDHRRLLWTIEQATGADLDRDGDVGEPRHKLVYVYGQRQPDLDATDFRHFVDAVWKRKRKPTWRAWKHARLPSGQTMTQELWEKYCQRLLKARCARRPNNKAPLELVTTYVETLRTFRELL